MCVCISTIGAEDVDDIFQGYHLSLTHSSMGHHTKEKEDVLHGKNDGFCRKSLVLLAIGKWEKESSNRDSIS